MDKRNWYQRKWGNARALRAKERRAVKRGSQKISRMDIAVDDRDIRLGKISKVFNGNMCCIISEEQEYIAGNSGAVIGDLVKFVASDSGNKIIDILPRKSKLVRMRFDASRQSSEACEEHVLAANIDVAVIVASAASPTFHPRLIDRYLIMCQYGNIAPVICVNKIDLVVTVPDLSAYTSLGIPVVYTSVVNNVGIPELRNHIKRKCAVLTGHSGVGKSALFNQLLGRDIQKTGQLTRGSSGRHTTTNSTMYALGDDTFIIDTPGLRALGLWDIGKETLKYYFPEFQEYASACKFRDCMHLHEPECAVKQAVGRGEVSEDRYRSYIKLLEEL